MDPFIKIEVVQYKDGIPSPIADNVASERKLRIFSKNKEILSLLCTPVMVRELVVGFGLSEGLLKGGDTSQTWCAERIEMLWKDDRIEVYMPVEVPEAAVTLTSGCAKGVTFIEDEQLPVIHDGFTISINAIFNLYREFQKKSELFKTTGGIHSAALCNEIEIIAFADDIGRHNAVDKIIGYAFLENITMQDKILLLSGRLSSEIVNKAVKAGVPVLISRAAPTDMSIKIAKKHNITLIGFLRGLRLNIYSKPERVK